MTTNKYYKQLAAILGGFLLILIFFGSLFVVDQREQVLVLQFGDPVRTIKEPGLKLKLPFIQDTIYFDNRILDLGIKEQEVIASDQKRLIIDAFTKYRITDPLKFYTTVNNIINAESKLVAILDSSLRRMIGEVPLNDLLTDNRAVIMSKIKEAVSAEAQIFGIQIADVRIVRGDLPKENSEAIFTRMQTERDKEAKEIRAKGAEEGEKIKAEADKQKTIILAEAKKEADIISGRGEAEAARISAAAFSADPEFFAFYRSLQAYSEALKSNNTTMILAPDGEFFKYFNSRSSR